MSLLKDNYHRLFCWILSGVASTSLAVVQLPAVVVTPPTKKNSSQQQLHSLLHHSSSNLLSPITQHNFSDRVDQIIQNQTGLLSHDLYGNGGHSTLSWRGFGDNAASNTAVVINDIPQGGPDSASAGLDDYPLALLRSVELVPASDATDYGDGAVAGIIKLATKLTLPDGTILNVGSGSYGFYQAGFTHAGTLTADQHYWLYLGRSIANNYRVNNAMQKNNVLFNYHQEQIGVLNILVHYWHDYLQLPGPLTDAQVTDDRRQPQQLNDWDFQDEYNQALQLNWQLPLSSDLFADLTAGVNQMHGHGYEGLSFGKARDSYFMSPALNYHFIYADKPGTLKTGLAFKQANYHLDAGAFFSEVVAHTQAAFSQAQWQLTPKFRVTAGARGALAQQQLFNGNHTTSAINRACVTSLSTRYQLQPGLSWQLARHDSYRIPNADENALTADQRPLKTQVGVTYETGIEATASRWQHTLNLYQINLRREISFVPPVDNITMGVNRNLAPTQRRGVTTSLAYRVMDGWQLALHYAYVDARFSQGAYAHKRLPLVANNNVATSSEWRWQDHYLLRLTALTHGNYFASNDDANASKRLGGYTLYNSDFLYENSWGSIGLSLLNLSNKPYYSYVMAINSGGHLLDYYYPAPLQHWLLTTTINLD